MVLVAYSASPQADILGHKSICHSLEKPMVYVCYCKVKIIVKTLERVGGIVEEARSHAMHYSSSSVLLVFPRCVAG